MKVILDLKDLKIGSMDNAMINIGKNWIVTRKKQASGGEHDCVERVGSDQAVGNARPDAGVRKSRTAPEDGTDEETVSS